jgi:type II secretory pathway component PulL
MAFRLVDGKALLEKDERMPRASEAVLSLPLSMLNFRFVDFPFGDAAKIRAALPFELEGLVLKGLDEIVFGFVMPGKETAGPAKVLAVYADKKLVSGMIGPLADIGAEPRIVTSLELGHIARSGEALAEALMEPAIPAGDERAEAALAEAQPPVVNLRTGELAYRKEEERFRRSLRKTAVLAALVFLMIIIGFGARAHFLKKEADALEARLKSRYAEILPIGVPASEAALEAKISQLKREKEAIGGIEAVEMLSALTGSRVKEAVLREMEMDSKGIVIRGEAPTLAAVEAQRGSLALRFRKAELLESETLSGKSVSFTLRVEP